VVEQSAVNRLVVGSSPTWGASTFLFSYALVAQWTRARGYELRCRGFESLLAQDFLVFFIICISLEEKA
jgi:hypothetical protein